MIIMLGSKNPSKLKSLKMTLDNIGIKDNEIFTYDVKSLVSSKPIEIDIIKGIDNRNNELKEIAKKENINYDYLCSIEGGFEQDITGEYFIITYCGIIDKNNNKYYGKSQGFKISKKMFEYIKKGNSLNKIIEEILQNQDNKQNLGITGFLSNGLLSRDIFDFQAVTSAFSTILFNDKYKELDTKIIKKNKFML